MSAPIYNRQRLYSGIGYLTPIEMEEKNPINDLTQGAGTLKDFMQFLMYDGAKE